MDDINTMPVSGDEFEQFKIVELIGTGGMSHVYKIFNKQLEVYRALKILKSDVPASSVARLETEAKIVANIRNKNVVDVFSSGMLNKQPFIEMEYIDGPSVDELISRGTLLPEIALSIILNVCEALTKAYNCNVTLYGKQYSKLIHRDIKPSNILITRKGVVKIADFGIARPSETSIHTIQMERALLGTPAYASPEQVNGEPLDQRSDIYAIGAVLYEMLTAEKLFPQETITDLLSKKSNEEYLKIKQKKINASKEVLRIVQKCLRVDKEERFEHTAELEEIIKKVLLTYKINDSEIPLIIEKYISGEKIKSLPARKQVRKKTSKKLLIVPGIIIVFILIYLKLFNQSKTEDFADTVNDSNSFEAPRLDSISFKPDEKPAEVKAIKIDETKDDTKTLNPIETPVKKVLPLNENLAQLLKKRNSAEVFSIIDTLSSMETIPNATFLSLVQLALEKGKYKLAVRLINNKEIHDGYYYYLKGRSLFHVNNYTDACENFIKSLTTPSPKNIKEENVYYLAITRNKLYVTNPSIENKSASEKALQTYIRMYCKDSQTNKCNEVTGLLKEVAAK